MTPKTIHTIPLFDIQAQQAPILKELQKEVVEVVNTSSYVMGKKGLDFEKAFSQVIGTKCAVGVSSGTSAIHMALLALGVKERAGVLTTPFTFIGSTIGIASAQGEIQFADIDPETMTIDPNRVNDKIKPNTQIIMPVHLYGYPADMDNILSLAKSKRLKVVEDCAQSHLTSFHGKKTGSMGDIGCFSFYVSKNLGAGGDAGACVTNNPEWDSALRSLRNNGSDAEYRYKHNLMGYNARLDEIQAAILNVKLKHLAHWTGKRREIAMVYRKELGSLPIQLPPPDTDEIYQTYHLFILRTPCRDLLKAHLEKAGISSGIYYPIPLHLQPAYKNLGFKKGDFPHSEKAANEVLAIPIFPELTDEQMDTIIGSIQNFFR